MASESCDRTICFDLASVAVREMVSRRLKQAPPPHVLFEALCEPNRDPQRHWLDLLDDETPPRILESHYPDSVTWSSIWNDRPDAIIRFDLTHDATGNGVGTDLRWTLYLDDPPPADEFVGQMKYRLNLLINGNLRYSFGQ